MGRRILFGRITVSKKVDLLLTSSAHTKEWEDTAQQPNEPGSAIRRPAI